MALDAILIAQINANTQAINKLNEDARKTSELPLMPVLDVNSLIRVEFGGISKHVKASQFAPPNAEFLEYIFNKQNDLSPDGTGIKYPTVDAVIDGLLLQKEYTDTLVADLVKVDKTNFKDIYQTGILRIDLDVSVLTVSPADTLTITACNNLLFVNEIAPDTPANQLADYLKSFGNKSFVANGTNTPLPVNTRGIFYVGLDKLGNQVYRTSKVFDQDIAYLARIVVENNGGVYTIVLNRYMPDLANNRINNRDRFVIASGSLVPSGAPSISFGNRGMSFYKNSINYATNKFDPNYLALADSVNPTPANFLFYLPNITNLAVSLATSTTINPTQWYTAGGALGGTAVNVTNYQVYKVYLSVTGTIIIQTKASTSNAPEAGVNAIFANRESALAGLTSTVFPALTPAGDYIALGTFFLRAGTAVNGSQMTDPNDFYFQAFTQTNSSSSVGVTEHDLLSGKNTNPAFQHVTNTEKVDWNTAFADRYKWDGSASGLDALLGRTSLGGTTIGQNLFTSPNPSAVRFLRANADNSISWLDANTFRTAIGAGTGNGTGNGTVTSVDLLAPTGLAVTGNPITTAGTLVLAYQAGYSIPTDARQANWDTAFGWGNHASAGYAFSNGSNATGTWGINITGNSNTTTLWGNRQANFDTLSTDVLRLLVIDSPTGIARQVDKSVIQSYLGINGGSFILNQSASAQSASMWIDGIIRTNSQVNAESFFNTGGYSFSANSFVFMNGDGSWYQNLSALNANFYGAVNAYDYRTSGAGFISYDGDNAGTGTLSIRNSIAGTVMHFTTDGKVGFGAPTPEYKVSIVNPKNTTGLFIQNSGVSVAGDYSQIGFGNYGNGNGVFGAIRSAFDNPAGSGNTSLQFFINGIGGLTEGLRIASSGNVLIGTTFDNGVDKLQVAGKISTQEITSNLFNFRSDNFKTANASIGKFSTFTGGGQDFELIFNRSAAGAGAYYGIQSVEQAVGYRNIALNQNGGNVLIGTTNDDGVGKLQVNGYARFSSVGDIGITNNTGGNSIIHFVGSSVGATSYDIGQGIFGVSNGGFSLRDITNGANRIGILTNGNVMIGSPLTANQRVTADGLFQSIDSKNQYLKIGMENDTAVIATDWFSGYGGAFRPLSFRVGGDEKFNISTSGVLTVPYLGNGSETRLVTVSPAGQIGSTVLPKRYKLMINQTGANAPVVEKEFINDFGAFTIIRNNVGIYQFSLVGAFPNGYAVALITNGNTTAGTCNANVGSTQSINIRTFNGSGVLSDDILYRATLYIEYYP